MMFSLPVLLLAVSFVSAAPMETELDKRAGVTAVSAATIASYKRYTMFARAAYCPPSTTATWTCGGAFEVYSPRITVTDCGVMIIANCDALPGFVTYGSGGDGAVTQYWYVGYDQTLGIVVGHQVCACFVPFSYRRHVDSCFWIVLVISFLGHQYKQVDRRPYRRQLVACSSEPNTVSWRSFVGLGA